jgi:hypothetical protein
VCVLAVSILAISSLSACGGSASETPWPKEPAGRHVGPAGEALPGGNVVDVKTLPIDKRYEKPGASDKAGGEAKDSPP